MHQKTPPPQLLSVPLLILIGCSGSLEATAPVLPPPPDSSDSFFESEPNDHASNANYIGELRVGDYVMIEGEVSECCVDPYDGFAFYAAEPLQLTITLTELADADLDFCMYDPTIDQMVACWETDVHPEWGVFNVGLPADLHLVVASYYGTSGYTLEIYADALGAAPDAPGAPGRGESPAELTRERFAGYHRAQQGEGSERYFLLLRDGETKVFLPLQGEEDPLPR